MHATTTTFRAVVARTTRPHIPSSYLLLWSCYSTTIPPSTISLQHHDTSSKNKLRTKKAKRTTSSGSGGRGRGPKQSISNTKDPIQLHEALSFLQTLSPQQLVELMSKARYSVEENNTTTTKQSSDDISPQPTSPPPRTSAMFTRLNPKTFESFLAGLDTATTTPTQALISIFQYRDLDTLISSRGVAKTTATTWLNNWPDFVTYVSKLTAIQKGLFLLGMDHHKYGRLHYTYPYQDYSMEQFVSAVQQDPFTVFHKAKLHNGVALADAIWEAHHDVTSSPPLSRLNYCIANDLANSHDMFYKSTRLDQLISDQTSPATSSPPPPINELILPQFIARDGDDWYLPSILRAEQQVAAGLSVFHPTPLPADEAYVSEICQLDNEQRTQVLKILRSRAHISFLTGGPGTGKTFAIKALVSAWTRMGLVVEVCCPTARAANKVKASTSIPARTIHSLFHIFPNTDTGDFDEESAKSLSSNIDVLVIDEASMVAVSLMSTILNRASSRTRIVLVGDPDQLSPISPGAVLYEMCTSMSNLPRHMERWGKLSVIKRQADGAASKIIVVADVVNHSRIFPFNEVEQYKMKDIGRAGSTPITGRTTASGSGSDRVVFMDTAGVNTMSGDRQSTIKLYMEHICTSVIPNRQEAMERGIMFLSPLRAETKLLNIAVRDLLNPHGTPEPSMRLDSDVIPRVGDRVLQLRRGTSNQRGTTARRGGGVSRMVAHGTLGIVTGFHSPHGELLMTVNFDDDSVETYTMAEAKQELTLGFATTIHQSQGNEFGFVVVLLPPHIKQYEMVGGRELMYTAFTRAKEMLIVVGSRSSVTSAVALDRKVGVTNLAHRVANAMNVKETAGMRQLTHDELLEKVRQVSRLWAAKSQGRRRIRGVSGALNMAEGWVVDVDTVVNVGAAAAAAENPSRSPPVLMPSSRDASVKYTVTANSCTCIGFQMRKTCRHVKEYRNSNNNNE